MIRRPKTYCCCSIYPISGRRLGEEIQAIDAASRLIHVDVGDGRFVWPLHWSSLIVEAIRPVTQKIIDVQFQFIRSQKSM